MAGDLTKIPIPLELTSLGFEVVNYLMALTDEIAPLTGFSAGSGLTVTTGSGTVEYAVQLAAGSGLIVTGTAIDTDGTVLAKIADLATVATSGDYGDLANTPSPTDLLNDIKTVDGAGSGLDADLLDGLQGSSYASAASLATVATTGDYADLINTPSASDLLDDIKTVDGTGSGLDADLLDGLEGSAYAALSGATFTGDVTVPNINATGKIVLDSGPEIAGVNGNPTITGQIRPLGSVITRTDGIEALYLKTGTGSTDWTEIALLSGGTFTGDVTVPNLITSGNVDGRDVSVDGAKLDGIEAGATADQTAADIRTLGFFDTSNDGASSGLDADLLDGQHGSYYRDASNLNAGSILDARVPQSAVTQHEAAIDHDNLTGFVANEHIDHSAVSIATTAPLTGGGTIASTRTLQLSLASESGLGLNGSSQLALKGFPAFSCYNTVTQTNQTGNGTYASFFASAEDYDITSDLVNGTFTCPLAGLYEFWGWITFTTDSGMDWVRCMIGHYDDSTSSTTYWRGHWSNGYVERELAGDLILCSVHAMVQMDVSDTAQLFGAVGGLGSNTIDFLGTTLTERINGFQGRFVSLV